MMLLKLKVPVFCVLLSAICLQVAHSRPWGNDDSDFNRFEFDKGFFEEEIPERIELESFENSGFSDDERTDDAEDDVGIYKRELEDDIVEQPEINNEFDEKEDDVAEEERKVDEEAEEELAKAEIEEDKVDKEEEAKEEEEDAAKEEEDEAKQEEEEEEEEAAEEKEDEEDETEYNNEEDGRNERPEGPQQEEIEEHAVEENNPEEDAQEEEIKLEAEIDEEENNIRGELPPWREHFGGEEVDERYGSDAKPTFEEVPMVDNDESNFNYTFGDDDDIRWSPPRRFFNKIKKYIKDIFSG